MVLFELYHSGNSVKLLKSGSSFLSAKIPPALGVSEALSYDWHLSVTTSSVIVAFVGARKDIKWIYDLERLKLKGTIDLCSANQTLDLPLDIDKKTLIIMLLGLLCIVFVIGMTVGHEIILSNLKFNPSHRNFEDAYQSVINHYMQKNKLDSFTALKAGMEMTSEKLCNPRDSTDCIQLEDCRLTNLSKKTKFPHWSFSFQTKCKLTMQHDGNLVLYNGDGEPLMSSGTNGRECTEVTYTNGEFQLHCSHTSISWKPK